MSAITDFFSGINYFGWQTNVKVIFLSLSFIFLCIAIYSFIKVHGIMKGHREHMIHEHAGEHHGEEHVVEHEIAPAHEAETAHEEQVSGEWENIANKVESVREADWKLAVIEADKYVDSALRDAGFAGETMGERLMMIKPDQLSSIQDLWDAHKLRNLLVHDTTYNVQQGQAIAAIKAFEKVLKELGVIR